MDDNTWKPNIVEATHTSLYNLADALRRRPRRAKGYNKTEHRDNNDKPHKAQWGKPSSKANRRTDFLQIKRNVEGAILNQGAAMLRFVEGAGTAKVAETPPHFYLNHDRRRLQFIGAVQRLRDARATAGHVRDGQTLDASTSGVPDQGIRRKHIEFWPVPREIILTMRTFTADLHNELMASEVNRAHMSTYIHHEEEAQGDEYWDEEETPEYESTAISHMHLPNGAIGSPNCYIPPISRERNTSYVMGRP